MPINAEMMEKRTKESAHRPKFIRPESWRYDRLRTTWRKPKGVDNHQLNKKAVDAPEFWNK